MQSILLAPTTAAVRTAIIPVGPVPVMVALYSADGAVDVNAACSVDVRLNGVWRQLQRPREGAVSLSRDNPIALLQGPAVYSINKPASVEAVGFLLQRADEPPEDMVHRGLYFGSSPIVSVPSNGQADVLVRCGVGVVTKARLGMVAETKQWLDVFPVTAIGTPGTAVNVNNFWVGHANVPLLQCSTEPTELTLGPRIVRFLLASGKQATVGSVLPVPFILPPGANILLRAVNAEAQIGDCALSLNFAELPTPL